MTSFTLEFNTEECGICYDTKCDIHITTHCGHEMCSDCYNSLQSTTCPYCRQQLNIEPNPFTGIRDRRIVVWPEFIIVPPYERFELAIVQLLGRSLNIERRTTNKKKKSKYKNKKKQYNHLQYQKKQQMKRFNRR